MNIRRVLPLMVYFCNIPNFRTYLRFVSYNALANKGKNHAATRAREAAYTEQKSVESFDNLLLNESNNQPTIQPTKYSSFYDDYLKSKNSKDSKNLWNNISKVLDLPKANKNSLDASTIPCAPAIYSVAGGSAGPGTSGENDGNCGHTGVILSCELTETGDYRLTYFHTYSGLLNKGETSAITTKTFTPEQLKNTTFLDLKNHMI